MPGAEAGEKPEDWSKSILVGSGPGGVLTDAGGAGRFTAAGKRRIRTVLSPFPSAADPR
jgi:hypothetical protein